MAAGVAAFWGDEADGLDSWREGELSLAVESSAVLELGEVGEAVFVALGVVDQVGADGGDVEAQAIDGVEVELAEDDNVGSGREGLPVLGEAAFDSNGGFGGATERDFGGDVGAVWFVEGQLSPAPFG